MAGETDQTNFGLESQTLPLISNAPVDVLLIQTLVLTQPIVGIVKLAIGGVETYIGTTPTAEVPQGFWATIFALNELGYELAPSELVTPQEDFKKVCDMLEGGGWLYIIGEEPSLNVIVYVVPEGLFSVPVIGNVNCSELQISVFPGFPKETAGLDPTKTTYFFVTGQPLLLWIV